MKIAAFSKIADMLAKEHRIVLREAESWKANIRSRELFYKKNDVYDLEEDYVLGLLLHEIAHIHYTTETNFEKNTHPEMAGVILNMVEDNSIEHIIGNDYPNAAEILHRTQQEMLDVLIRMLPKMTNVSRHEKALLYGAVRFNGRGYETPILEHEMVGQKIADYMETKRNEILGRRTTPDLMPIVDEIMKILLKEIGEPEEWEKNSMRQNNEDNYGDLKNQTSQAGNGGIRKGLIDALKEGSNGDGYSWSGTHDLGLQGIDEIMQQAHKIGGDLRRVLRRNQAMEFGGRFRTGKLKTKNLARIRVNHDRKPFGRRVIKSNQSYAFAVAADASGSMFGGGQRQKANYAFSSLYMVAEALRIADVQRVLIAFGNMAITVKPMSKKQIRWNEINDERIGRETGGGTEIDLAMNLAINELDKVTAERKIMVILTDGESSIDPIKEQYKRAQKKDIEMVAITIGSNSTLSRIFKPSEHIRIEKTSDCSVGNAFIKILKDAIKADAGKIQ